MGIVDFLIPSVDGSEIPTTWDVFQSLVDNGINYLQPQLVS